MLTTGRPGVDLRDDNSAYRQVLNHSLVSCMIAGRWRVCCDVCLAESVNYLSFIPVSSILFFSVCIFLFRSPLLFWLVLYFSQFSFSSVIVLYCFVFSWFVLFYLVVYGISLKYRPPCALCEEIMKFGTDDL